MTVIYDIHGNTRSKQTNTMTDAQIKEANELEDARLKAISIMNIKNNLIKQLSSTKETFIKNIEFNKFTLKDNKEEIMQSDVFLDVFFNSKFLTIFTELENCNLDPAKNPMAYAIVVIFDKLYFQNKWKLIQIIKYFTKQNKIMIEDAEYKETFAKEATLFYNTLIDENNA